MKHASLWLSPPQSSGDGIKNRFPCRAFRLPFHLLLRESIFRMAAKVMGKRCCADNLVSDAGKSVGVTLPSFRRDPVQSVSRRS